MCSKKRYKELQDDKLFKELRDRGKCEICGITDQTLAVHHIIPRRYKESTNNETNLMVLCTRCHASIEKYISFAKDIDGIYRRTGKYVELHKNECACKKQLW